MAQKDSQARKFLMTLCHPEKYDLTSEKCIEMAQSLKGLRYACAAEEIGVKEHTPHIHMFVYYENPKSWKTMTNLLSHANWQVCKGSSTENRDYVFKLGKWVNTEKGTTTVAGTQVEFGELPPERACAKPELALLFELIQQGLSDYEIISEYPEYMFDLSHIQRVRLTLKQEEYSEKWRDLTVVYVFGPTGVGKSRSIMEKYGYSNVFRVTDYSRHPFDTYKMEDVICFEEFSSSLRIQEMLNYLDGYPLKLPARYADKQACYTKAFLVSNIDPLSQYPSVATENREVWNAFWRRVTHVVWFKSPTEQFVYKGLSGYLNRDPVSGLPVEEFDF